ncbi:MAG: alpha-amylase [Ferruginibacter sp.]|nr:alpha-amylase [Cytophagales bacterium]
MTAICFCFQAHQPFRLKHYDFFRIGHDHTYADPARDEVALNQAADQTYLPANQRLLALIRRSAVQSSGPGSVGHRFKFALSLSGTVLEQLWRYRPDALTSFRGLIDAQGAEVLGGTHYHSFPFLYSPREFRRQVDQHRLTTETLLDVSPTLFRNPQAGYGNDIARAAEEMGFPGILSDGHDSLLLGRSPNHVYAPLGTRRIRALLQNQSLSEDLATRFSRPDWSAYPLGPAVFADWLEKGVRTGESVLNLWLDYGAFAQPGFLDFLEGLVAEVHRRPGLDFRTPSEVLATYPVKGTYDVPRSANWAEIQKDLPAGTENYLQREAVERVYRLEESVLASASEDLLRVWGSLQSADHFHGMANGQPDRYDAYINYMNVLTDLEERLA